MSQDVVETAHLWPRMAALEQGKPVLEEGDTSVPDATALPPPLAVLLPWARQQARTDLKAPSRARNRKDVRRARQVSVILKYKLCER